MINLLRSAVADQGVKFWDLNLVGIDATNTSVLLKLAHETLGHSILFRADMVVIADSLPLETLRRHFEDEYSAPTVKYSIRHQSVTVLKDEVQTNLKDVVKKNKAGFTPRDPSNDTLTGILAVAHMGRRGKLWHKWMRPGEQI